MIFYFSGTGNSEYTARRLAEKIGGDVVSIGESARAGISEFTLTDSETLGFVFPVYALDVPEIVLNFIKDLKLENYSNQYAFAVLTYGAHTGMTCSRLREALAEKNIALKLAYDLCMPDNYIVMFNPPTPEKEEKMLTAAENTIAEIAQAIESRTETVILKGKNPPSFISRLVSYLFNKYSMSTKKFRTTDACTSCGLCERICPDAAITKEHHGYRWREGNCAKCMGCINRCPAHAIEYGASTVKRGRYLHPTYKKVDSN